MPIHRGRSGNKCYYQWGNHGAKYMYTPGNTASRTRAYNKALRQERAERAARAAGWRGY